MYFKNEESYLKKIFMKPVNSTPPPIKSGGVASPVQEVSPSLFFFSSFR